MSKSYFPVRQPVVQQLKSLFDEVKADFHTQDSKLDAKIDTLISLQKERLALDTQMQKERLALEREKLQFEREKAGLAHPPSAAGDFNSNV